MLTNSGLIPEQIDRPDEDVWADVWARLWRDAATRALERSALELEVHNAEVFLLGHVTTVMHRRQMAELARGVRGVKAVHNTLVADPDLVTDVAQALAADARTRPHLIRVGAFHGWIHLGGEVPDVETRAAVEQVAAGVSRVRGVLALPHLPQAPTHHVESGRPLQPHLGEAVYALDGPAGQVARVVISPQNRRVSHIVVAGNLEVNRQTIRGQWVVPVEALPQANEGGVFLSETLGTLTARPTFDEADFPLAPADWAPPFPYAPGTVRWPSNALCETAGAPWKPKAAMTPSVQVTSAPNSEPALPNWKPAVSTVVQAA